MASGNKINYNARSFSSIKDELLSYVKQYYPDLITDFSDATVGRMLLDLVAALGDNLSMNTDRVFQETQLDSAIERKSILAIAKNLGVQIPGKRGSITLVNFSVNVPVKGDTFDTDYLPVIGIGTQILGGGQTFEVLSNIDFSSPFSQGGSPNRLIIPTVDANNILQYYTITKSEIVYNGSTTVFKKYIQNATQFLEIILPNQDVLDIEQIITLDGLQSNDPSINDFLNEDYRYFEVDYLLQQKVLGENVSSNKNTIQSAQWKTVTKKFIKEFTDKGFCKLTFGGGNGDLDLIEQYLTDSVFTENFTQYLENSSLGEMPKQGSTLFVRYRTGGGLGSNVGAGILTQVGNVDIFVNGPLDSKNRTVKQSLKVTNPIPAFGGSETPTTEQVRKMISYNFSAQERCVTLSDYSARVSKMPGKYGAPFKYNVYKSGNKVIVTILTLDENGKLTNTSPNILKNNVAEYISEYRMVNDFVEIEDGRIFDLAFDFTLMIDDVTDTKIIANNVITTISDFININTIDINQEIYLGNIIHAIDNVPGVLNTIDYKVYNKVGGNYSANEIEMVYKDGFTREIQLVNNTIYSSFDAVLNIRYPNADIRIFCKRRYQLNK